MIDKFFQQGQPMRAATKNAARQIASALLGPIEWHSHEEHGYCRCPGVHLHHSPNGKRDTRIYLDRVPTITCFHASCIAAVENANRKLRSAIGQYGRGSNPYIERAEKTAAQMAREGEKREAEQLAVLAARALPRILREYHWPLTDIYHDSPEALDDEPSNHWRAMLRLFAPDDVVWIGGKYDSGSPCKARYFRRAAEWMNLPACPPGPHVSPFTFMPGTYSRKAEYVQARKYLVIESDSLPMEQQGAVLRWLRDAVGMQLRGVADVAGKSIHGWFDPPDDAVMRELDSVVPALKCDPAMLQPSQVSRLPGCRRGQGTQRLLYLDSRRNI